MRITNLLAGLLACALGLVFTTARAQDKSQTGPQKIVRNGVEIEFTVEPAAKGEANALLAGEDAVFRFKLRDTTTKTPLASARPMAWVAQRERSGPLGPDQCRAKVESFLQGSLRSRPDVDLNAFYVLALNEDASISVIDPLLGFGGSKLLALALLKSPGEDWVLTSDRTKLFVSMPRANQVAVIDTATWKVIADVATGTGPMRLALQPDEKYLWVADENGVTAIDMSTLKVAKQIAAGAGQHEIAFGVNNRFAFVSNREAGTLSVIDIAKLKTIKEIKLGARISSLAFSPLSKALYVTNELDGTLTAIDVASHKVLTTINTKPGIETIRFARGGRWGFIANTAESKVYILDASTNRILHEQTVGEAPDQFAFTDNFAYVRSLGSDQVSAIRLINLENAIDVVKFPGGQLTPGSTKAFASSADAFVPAPEPGAVLFANPADKMIYYYSEGMAAPMGNFQNYRRVPRAVKIVDRSLREETTGVYTTTARLPKHGTYNVSLLLDSPRVVHCFEATAKLNPALPEESETTLRVEYLNREAPLVPGEDHKIRFKLTDTSSKSGAVSPKDVGVLVFLSPGTWQQRQIARHVGDGVYEATVNVPEAGVYLVFVESPSLRLRYRQLPYLTLHSSLKEAQKGPGN
ncbi:MAG TPA: cytochrome D1 domain-containing protein [Pyrinomonadaceae bacterium]|nr:cytochrome D1 domain-containing protein [Pyrinomonadaceae bacterium]